MTARTEFTTVGDKGWTVRRGHDLDLVYRHAAGDPAAFEEIFETHQRMIYNLALRFCGDPTRAEDLAQEALLRISCNLKSFRGKSSLKTWIYQVSINCFRSRLRRRRLDTRSLDDESAAPQPVDAGLSPESRAYGAELQDRLTAAIAELPAKFREAVILRDVEGLDYREIETILGCRLGTVRSRIARGRAALRDALKGQTDLRTHQG